MTLLKKIMGRQSPIKTYDDFWKWFTAGEKSFYKTIKSQRNIEKDFFNKLSPKLGELGEGFYFLTGMLDEDTVELVITPDGDVRKIIFVEELVQAAPKLKGWKFTALKPALDIENVTIRMGEFEFSKETLNFYTNDDAAYPDSIDITITHPAVNKKNEEAVAQGIFIFLDNYLGELDAATTIDNVEIINKKAAKKELVPIEKLKAFLTWRKKEFVEKYEGERHNTSDDAYSVMEAELDDGSPLLAVVNTDLLGWGAKASHPWVVNIAIGYDGKKNKGMPDRPTLALLDEIEEEIMDELKDADGYLNIGRQTSSNLREIYFACKDFRKPSKVLSEIQKTYSGKVTVDFEIYIDKYWRTFDRFTGHE